MDDCEQCGHPDGDHLICGEADELIGAPTRGWRECPVAGCICYATWSVSPGLLERLRKHVEKR